MLRARKRSCRVYVYDGVAVENYASKEEHCSLHAEKKNINTSLNFFIIFWPFNSGMLEVCCNLNIEITQCSYYISSSFLPHSGDALMHLDKLCISISFIPFVEIYAGAHFSTISLINHPNAGIINGCADNGRQKRKTFCFLLPICV